jgi:hypothetical protein
MDEADLLKADGSEVAEAGEVHENENEETLVLDVNVPHPTQTWKDFFIHVGTICVGLLIAVSLEQMVEYIHHRSEVAEARRALAVERKLNINFFAAEAEEFHRFVPGIEDGPCDPGVSAGASARTGIAVAGEVRPVQRVLRF